MIYQLLRAGWLTDLTNWLLGIVKGVWDAFTRFMGDLLLIWLKHQFDMVLMLVEKLPVPEFLSQNNLQSLFGQGGATIGWWISVLQIDKCFTVIGAALVFFIVRRIVTLGIW